MGPTGRIIGTYLDKYINNGYNKWIKYVNTSLLRAQLQFQRLVFLQHLRRCDNSLQEIFIDTLSLYGSIGRRMENL